MSDGFHPLEHGDQLLTLVIEIYYPKKPTASFPGTEWCSTSVCACVCSHDQPPKIPLLHQHPWFPRNHSMMHKQTNAQAGYPKKEQNKQNERKLGLGLCLQGNGCYGSQLKPKQCSLTLRKLDRYVDSMWETATSLINSKHSTHNWNQRQSSYWPNI